MWDELAGYNDTEQREPRTDAPASVLQDYRSFGSWKREYKEHEQCATELSRWKYTEEHEQCATKLPRWEYAEEHKQCITELPRWEPRNTSNLLDAAGRGNGGRSSLLALQDHSWNNAASGSSFGRKELSIQEHSKIFGYQQPLFSRGNIRNHLVNLLRRPNSDVHQGNTVCPAAQSDLGTHY